MLGALGLEPAEEAIYRALLGRPSATATQLASVLELTGSRTWRRRCSRLEECGLVDPLRRLAATARRHRRWRSAP